MASMLTSWHRAWVNPRLPRGTYISCVSDIRKRQGCHSWVNIDLAIDSLNTCGVVYSGSPRCSSPLKWQEDTKRSFVSCRSSHLNAIENNTNSSQCWNTIDVYRCRSREMMNVSTFCYNQEEDYVLRPEWLQDMIWVQFVVNLKEIMNQAVILTICLTNVTRWIDPWHVSPRCCLKNACRNRWVCMLEFTTPKKTSRTVVFRCIFQKKTPWVSHSPRYGSGWLESRSLCWRDTKVATLLEILKRKYYFPTIIFQALLILRGVELLATHQSHQSHG